MFFLCDVVVTWTFDVTLTSKMRNISHFMVQNEQEGNCLDGGIQSSHLFWHLAPKTTILSPQTNLTQTTESIKTIDTHLNNSIASIAKTLPTAERDSKNPEIYRAISA